MAITFGDHKVERGAYAHARSAIGPSRARVEEQYIYGDNVAINPVPQWTAKEERRPIVIFRDPEKNTVFGLNETDLSKGVLYIGDPGVGKTNTNMHLIDACLRRMGERDVLIIYDPKGDYYRFFGPRLPREFVTVISAAPEYRAIAKVWNLFGEIMDKNSRGSYLVDSVFTILYGQEMGSALVKDVESLQQPFFHIAAMLIFGDLVIFLIRDAMTKRDTSNLNNRALVKRVNSMTAAELLDMYEASFMADRRGDRDFISKIDSNQTQGVISFMRAAVNRTLVGSFGGIGGEAEFSMREIIMAPRQHVMFLIDDPRLGETMAPVYGILVDSAIRTQLGAGILNGPKKNLFLNLDEAKMVPGTLLGKAVSVGRSLGIKTVLGVQNIQQLRMVHGEKEANEIYAGLSTLVAFHSNDPETREFVRERLGRNRKLVGSRRNNERVWEETDGWTAEDWQLEGLNTGDAVVRMVGERPFLFHFAEFIS